MRPEVDVVDVEELEIRLFLEAIHAAYGYDLRDYSEPSMRRRVLAALARSGFDNLGELQHAALSDAGVFAQVIDDLTVRVSELFRDPSFYRAFRGRVVPLLRTYPELKIWHAGCATGEEVYSTAMLLEEEGLYERAQIYATDLNPGALEAARRGVYPGSAAAGFAANHRAAGGVGDVGDCVTTAYSHFAFRERLKKNVLFFQHDLVGDHVFGEMHVVFCRNVLLYFGHELRRRVLDKLARSLAPGGFLCLGSAERIGRTFPSDALVAFAPDVNVYRRKD